MTTSGAPALNPRDLALAHYAGRALLENVLARHGATFAQSVVLRAVAAGGGSVDGEDLVADVVASLKLDEPAVRGVAAELTAGHLLEQDGPALRLTDAGRALYETTTKEGGELTAKVYGGIPADDLAVAGRVVALITERANALLAAA